MIRNQLTTMAVYVGFEMDWIIMAWYYFQDDE